MKSWSLARIDFNLPQQYELSGRNQNIYYVDVKENALREKTAKELWDNRLQAVKQKHAKAGYPEKTIQVNEIEPGFQAVFYKANQSDPELVTLEAQKTVGKNVLEMSFEGKAGKENDMLRGISIIAGAYRTELSHGFNVGVGSITSTPGLNEHARASFTDHTNGIELSISTQVATAYLTKHPLDDIEHETKGLAQDGITLKVLKNEERAVAGFKGNEGHITLENMDEGPQFRFTWFTPGITADSFKPEILIKVHGPLKNMEAFKPVWEALLQSLKVRSAI